jgi:Ppx/GppA phosphatase family/CHAD domain
MTVVDTHPLVAAIDIGSNSIKMTVGRANDAGGIDEVDGVSEVVRLGQGLEATGKLDESRMAAAIKTLKHFNARAEELCASRIVAVATEATRAASNGAKFLKRAQAETGIPIRVLSGLEEAALTFRGLGATSDLSGQLLVADIGGGSTELITASDAKMQSVKSIPLGSGRLTDKLIASDPPTTQELAASEEAAATALVAVLGELSVSRGAEARLIVVGGTGEYLSRLVPDESNIDEATIREVLSRLTRMTATSLAEAIQIPEARARLLPAGLVIVTALTELMQPKCIEIGRGGVRAGLLLETSTYSQSRQPRPILAPVRGNGKERRRVGQRGASDAGDCGQGERDYRETMKALIADRWDAVWKAVPVAIEGTDTEGVHDVRVASRRLRAAMDIAAPAFPRSWYRPLHRAAKEITSALGEVRDRDVLLEALRADRESAPLAEHPGIDRLIDRVERERLAARAELELYLTDLLAGSLRNEAQRRFAPVDQRVAAASGREEIVP